MDPNMCAIERRPSQSGYSPTQNPQYLGRLRAEIRAAFPGGCPATVSYEQLDALKLLRNITEEVARVYPPVAVTSRENNRDTTLGGQFVPKGTMLVFAPWALNRDPAVWGADADEFRPERLDDEMVSGLSNYNVLTFLAGPRNCIGINFAKMEFKALLAALVGRLDFEAPKRLEPMEIIGGITNRPKDVTVKITVVDGW